MKISDESKWEEIGVALMAIALFGAVLVNPMPAHAEGNRDDSGKARQGEFFEKRTHKLHDELKLAASQESAWNTFVEKTRPNEHRPPVDKAELEKLSTPERLDRLLAASKDRQQKFEAHVDAVKTFYAQLTPEQKKTFDASFKPFGGYHRHDGHHD